MLRWSPQIFLTKIGDGVIFHLDCTPPKCPERIPQNGHIKFNRNLIGRRTTSMPQNHDIGRKKRTISAPAQMAARKRRKAAKRMKRAQHSYVPPSLARSSF